MGDKTPPPTRTQSTHAKCPQWLSGSCKGGKCGCFPDGTPGPTVDESIWRKRKK